MCYTATNTASGVTGVVSQRGFYSTIDGADSWQLYMGGTARSFIGGDLGIGTSIPSAKLNVEAGSVVFNGNNGSNTFKVGSTASDNLLYVDGTSNDKVGIGTNDPTEKLDINSDAIRIRTAQTPASGTATGNAGDICWDSDYIYVCVATNTWKRSSLTSW